MSEGEQHAQRKIVNWPQYNRALIQRGSITLWFDRDIEQVWFARKTGRTGRGLHRTFSDEALQACLMLRVRFGLTLRSMEGFVNSLFSLMGLGLKCPGYTLFSKPRVQALQLALPRRLPCGAVDVVVDSTGLKVYGEGEWKVRQHGAGKRRTWRKLHLGVDPNNHEVVAAELTTHSVGDNEVLPDLLEQLGEQPLGDVYGDGAYDTVECYRAIGERGGQAVIPPRRGSVSWAEDHPRNAAVSACESEAGRGDWKRRTGYHRRSLAETAMYRMKQLVGPRLRSRRFDLQQVEVHAGIAVLNRMASLGMPERA